MKIKPIIFWEFFQLAIAIVLASIGLKAFLLPNGFLDGESIFFKKIAEEIQSKRWFSSVISNLSVLEYFCFRKRLVVMKIYNSTFHIINC